jgi:thiol:disulfide interchange protein DsbG
MSPCIIFKKVSRLNSTISALTLAIALAFSLMGCSKPDAPAQPSAATASPAQTYEAVAAQGKGFTVGAMMSAHPVYVLFDPQCPHCGHLWEASLPLQSKAKFVWIPVSIINTTSTRQGVALLSANNPAEAMAAHEKSILAGTGGMSAPATMSPDLEQTIRKNTALFSSLGVDSVPYIIARNVSTGLVVSNTGSMTTAELAALLGIAPP